METLVWTNEMLISGIILAVTFIAIFTEGIHGYHRAKCAMAGAAAMVVAGYFVGFYDPELALEAIDWNVIFLLGSMMMVIAIMIPTGGFQSMAFNIARFSGGRLYLLLVLLGTAVTVLSLLLDNVTTIVIFGPLIILICHALGVTPVPYLLAGALLTDTGGVATLVGDPPNLMIGSAADIDFNTFFIHMGPMVFCAWLATIIGMKYMFKEELSVRPDMSRLAAPEPISDKRTWYGALVVLGLMVVGFVMHDALGWEPWVVSALGLTILIFIGHEIELEEQFTKLELTLLVFFISLFIIIGGVEHSGFLRYLAQFVIPYVENDLLVATLLVLWVSAIFSAMIDNIPFTAAMIPIILGMEQQGINVTPLWWALSAGVGMGGNGTHVGSTANVFIVTISEKLAKQTGRPEYAITPGIWFRKGTPVMLLTLVVCTVIMALFFDFFSAPIH